MELIKCAIDHTQKHCSGAVELSLYKVGSGDGAFWRW